MFAPIKVRNVSTSEKMSEGKECRRFVFDLYYMLKTSQLYSYSDLQISKLRMPRFCLCLAIYVEDVTVIQWHTDLKAKNVAVLLMNE
jgi:hypothetical protein